MSEYESYKVEENELDTRNSQISQKCDSRGGLEAARNKKPYTYVCHMGVVDVAIPIIYQNLYVGAVMCGQILLPEADKAHIEKIFSEKSAVDFAENEKLITISSPLCRKQTSTQTSAL